MSTPHDELKPVIDLTGYCKDEYLVELGDYEFVLKDGKTYFVKKQPQYPKTYEECCEVLDINELPYLCFDWNRDDDVQCVLLEYQIALSVKLDNLRKLLICRDAYWKIAGDWKPDWEDNNDCYFAIATTKGEIGLMSSLYIDNCILVFPTEEMRDAFYENFKELIEECKELL